MRRGRLSLAFVGVAALSLRTLAAPSEMRPQAEREAHNILARARQWAGGQAFEAVRSLTVRGTRGPRGQKQGSYGVSLLRPRYCQVEREGGWVHTLQLSTFWMAIPPAFQSSFSPDMRATAELGTRQVCVELAMIFLLRPPEGLGVTVVKAGSIAMEGLRGDGVHISLPGKEGNTFVFDREEGRMLGYVARRAGTPEIDVVLVSGHTILGGIRFPNHFEFHYGRVCQVVEKFSRVIIRRDDVTTLPFSPPSDLDSHQALAV